MKAFAPPRTEGERQRALLERQKLKMARSAHAYVRGNTAKFYEWLEGSTGTSLPAGPPLWICGDCHAGNLGPVSDTAGRVAIQIRDLDQTVIGNPAHDLIRLGLSLATAARSSDLPGVTTARIIEQMVQGYESALDGGARGKAFEAPGAIRVVLKQALRRGWKHLLEERLDDARPTIPRGPRFWSLRKDEKRAVDALFATEPVRELVTSLRCRDDGAAIEVVDAAYWMKGCSSLGRLRYAVLVHIRASKTVKKGKLCLIDIKEATAAAAPRCKSKSMPNADRVITGARHLAPYLGERMLAARLLNRSVFLRELMPQDLKLELERVSRDEATSIGRFLANVVGRAHARQMDETTRAKWKTELRRHRRKSLDAPSWLWSGVVDLLAAHEAGYLEHCRKYGLERRARRGASSARGKSPS